MLTTHRILNCLRCFTIFYAASFSVLAEDKIYKWLDEEGNIHYTQAMPPDKMAVESINPSLPEVDSQTAIEHFKVQSEAANQLRKDRLNAAEQKQAAKKEARKNRQLCQTAKKRLASYQRNRVRKEEADGTSRIIPEEERQEEIKKSKQYIKEVCQ